MFKCRIGPYVNFGKVSWQVPEVWEVDRFSPWGFKREKFKNKPHTIHYWQFIPLETKLEIAKNQP